VGGAQSSLFSLFPDDKYSLMESYDGDKEASHDKDFGKYF